VGPQYRSVILTHSERQRVEAIEAIRSIGSQEVWPGPIVTEVAPLDVFYLAETGHQGYFRRNPGQGYCQVVIAPKVASFRKRHLDRLRA
jgi:peptide-methionine (S)-S-oxide reductase